ncbi:MAG: Crp/Fnr family transcriptional regulator [Limnochordia bacterium]
MVYDQAKLACLQNSFLFAGLDQEDLLALSRVGQLRDLAPGNILFQEGEEAVGLYILGSGLVKIFKLSADGKEYVLHLLGPGEPLGEAAVFARGNYPASAVALKPSSALYIPRQHFLELIGQRPQLAMGMLATLSQRLRRFSLIIEDLAFREVGGRLARFLLDSAQDGQVDLEITKGELAKTLGTSAETLSRTLTRLSDLGLITTQGRQMTILQRDRLADLAYSGRL